MNLTHHERIGIKNGKNITVEKHSVTDSYPLHWHSIFEIEIVISGRGKMILNDEEFEIAQRSIFFLTPTDFHSISVSEFTEVINITFDENMISERDLASLMLDKTKKVYTFSEDEYRRIVNAAEILENECLIEGSCRKTILEYIIKCILRKNDYTAQSSADDKNSDAIKRAIVFMELHFREDISLADVAREAGYNQTYFSEVFKKATGETYTKLLTRLRLSYAKMLLSNGFSVSEACFGSGFKSLSNFLEVFKKKYKIPPSDYRKSILN